MGLNLEISDKVIVKVDTISFNPFKEISYDSQRVAKKMELVKAQIFKGKDSLLVAKKILLLDDIYESTERRK